MKIIDKKVKWDKLSTNYANGKINDYIGIFASTNKEEAKKAIWNEFGTAKAPPRPFIVPTYIDNEKWINQQVLKSLKKLESPKLFMNVISLRLVEKVKHKINTMKHPKLAPSTIKKKGHGKLLVETGDMLSSVKHKREVH
ncbi:MAG: hypothetical protein ACRC6E_08260 [Fusobacteriaceae bacterium]